MRIKLTEQLETPPETNKVLPKPAGITDQEWRDLGPKYQQEFLDREEKYQAGKAEREAQQKEADKKAKWTPGTSVTPENLTDYFGNVESASQEARSKGGDIQDVLAARTAKAIEAQRQQERAIRQAESDRRAKENLEQISAHAKDLELTTTQPMIVTRVLGMESKLRQVGQDPATATPEQKKLADKYARHQKATETKDSIESLRRRARTLVDRYGNVGAETTDKGPVGGGRIEMPTGEIIDINVLKQKLEDFDTTGLIEDQEGQDNVKSEDRLRQNSDPTTNTYRETHRKLTELLRGVNRASEHFASLESPKKPKQESEAAPSSQPQSSQPSTGQTTKSSGTQGTPSPGSTPSTTKPSSGPNAPGPNWHASGMQPQPGTSENTINTEFVPATQKPKSSGIYSPDQALAQATPLPNKTINALAQQQLTKAVAAPSMKSDTDSSLVASAETGEKKNKDARYGAKKATAKGVVAVTEQPVRFMKNDLKLMLNEAKGGMTGKWWGLRQWKNWGKYKLPGYASKVLGSFLQTTNPIDRFPTNLFQAGYSKQKGLRQAKYLYNNPSKLVATIAAASAALPPQATNALRKWAGTAITSRIGLGVSGLLNNVLGNADETKQSFANAIPTLLSITDDPRHATLPADAIVKTSKKEEDDDDSTP
jgi:hypothetical protein